ncbi:MULTISPECIES: DNRLRE domain-containing protein [Anaerolinea]|uniref:DNRLRE domain-containing protein n=1 Tax=Anaerolinea TaxID=233189 RepID=UPI0026151D15|nr:DNRLRE domain-containing protein [Anaerolinea thermophila]
MKNILLIFFVFLLFASCAAQPYPEGNEGTQEVPLPSSTNPSGQSSFSIFLPTVMRPEESRYRINARFLPDETWLVPASIFWFGKVNRTENYVDVRVGYGDQNLKLHFEVFDRMLWYDTTPTTEELTRFDAIQVFLKTSGANGNNLDTSSYQFVAQSHPNYLNKSSYMASYRWNGQQWVNATIPFDIRLAYAGEGGYNQTSKDNRGWFIEVSIPYTSLGISQKPATGTTWGMAVILHDRDDASSSLHTQQWPPNGNLNVPATWGTLGFGLPIYTPPSSINQTTLIIREGWNAAKVPDASVGGSTVCGEGTDFFGTWGDTPESFYANRTVNNTQFNIQNQMDVADWPCFAKYYVTFPLNAIPTGKVIVSAKLILHHFGNSGAPGEAEDSLIHVMLAEKEWDERTLTWNNAPLALENYAAVYVPPLLSYPGDMGVRREWVITPALLRSYQKGEPLRLVLYSSDSARHSGKYFWASNRPDLEASRPTLEIIYGDPAP